ncbi:angiotensinogen [Antennarius striatus]|uniref:angiotensinogen n=1 Tax=Antennarius striatus TaxID=241820 RepID=UPI0035B20BC9
MKLSQKSLLTLLLYCWLSGSQANRIYIHPFTLFAGSVVDQCLPMDDMALKPVQPIPVAPLDIDILTPDDRDIAQQPAQKPNVTDGMLVLIQPLNMVSLRMYKGLSKRQRNTNTLFSPLGAYGSLATLSMGASMRTTNFFQLFLSVTSGTDQEDCVFLVDGHRIIMNMQKINSLFNDELKNEITTRVWNFIRHDALLSKDYYEGIQEFCDSSFVRGVDFSKPEEAEELVRKFLGKTSDGKVKSSFKDLKSNTDLLFLSSVNFKGNWQTAFRPEKTFLQEFYVDETTTVMAPLMTRTGRYEYLIDQTRKCTVVKLHLSTLSYLMLVLPHERSKLRTIESRLLTDIISSWQRSFHEGLLELSVPKFSMSSVTDLREALMAVNPEIEEKLLGLDADFTRMSNINPFTINKVFNEVTFEISGEPGEETEETEETGTPLKLTINRPFFFAVIERNTNAYLMLGKITNPTL